MLNPVLNLPQITLGAALALVAVAAAYLLRKLTISGALTAFILGAMVFGFGGLPWAVLLLTFFVTSSFLSRIFKRRKMASGAEFEKSSRRDGWQVLANGGIAGLMVVLSWIYPFSVLPWMTGASVLAAANADTWATELGVLSSRDPVLISTGKRVRPGTSGAVSLAGILAAVTGSIVVAGVFLAFTPQLFPGLAGQTRWWLAATVALGGLAGSLVDSLLGATLQAVYYCPNCQKETEKHPLHRCGTPTMLIRGHHWLNNDWVNFFCTLSGAIIALAIGILLYF